MSRSSSPPTVLPPRAKLSPLSGEQVRLVIERHAQRHKCSFTATVQTLAREGGMGRSTLFTWLHDGLPMRQNSSVRQTLVTLAHEYGIIGDTTKGEEHGTQ